MQSNRFIFNVYFLHSTDWLRRIETIRACRNELRLLGSSPCSLMLTSFRKQRSSER